MSPDLKLARWALLAMALSAGTAACSGEPGDADGGGGEDGSGGGSEDGTGGTSEDGVITIQEAQCLGYCDAAPCIQVDADQTRGPFTVEQADELLDELRAAPVPTRFVR